MNDKSDMSEQLKDKPFFQGEERLLVSESERFALALSSIGDAVITADKNGKIILFNRMAEKLTGWSSEEAVGQPVHKIFLVVDEESGELYEKLLERISQDGDMKNIFRDSILITRNAGKKLIVYSSSPIYTSRGEIFGSIYVFRDVTETRKREKDVQKVKRYETLNLLAGSIAHDVNNILFAIHTNLSLVKSKVTSDEVYQYLKEIENVVLQARNLTRQLLAFSKKSISLKRQISINDMVKEVYPFILRSSEIYCEVSFPADFWKVEAEDIQIRQILNNLIINARQSNPEGGKIRITGENIIVKKEQGLPLEEGRYVKVSVADEGVGIKEEYLEKIFDPYFSTKIEGSGLGLAIVRSMITKYKGYIAVESQIKKGTIFTFYLPACEKTGSLHLSLQKTSVSKGKVLIVDKEKSSAESVSGVLKQLGFETVLTETGDDAIKIMKQQKEKGQVCRSVVVDIDLLTGQDLKDFCQTMKTIDPSVRVLIAIAENQDPFVKEVQEQGLGDVLIKPYRMKDLSRLLQ